MYALGRDKAPISEESEKIVDFFVNEIKVLKGAAVLDLHEVQAMKKGALLIRRQVLTCISLEKQQDLIR